MPTPRRLGKIAAYQESPIVDQNYAAGDRTINPRLTFLRASGATVFGSNGFLQSVAVNEPRFNYDDGNGNAICLGLQVEPARTNLTLQSNFIDTDSGNGGVTVTLDQTGPDGNANSAWRINDSAAASNQYCRISTATVTAVPHTFYAIVKAGTTSKVQLSFGGAIGGGSAYANFNLSGVGTVLASGGVTNPLIRRYGANGWYRISFQCTPTAGTGNACIVCFITNDTDGRVTFQAGTGARTFVVYGAQVEQGTFPTSLILTNGASATRAADMLTTQASWYDTWGRKSGALSVIFEYTQQGQDIFPGTPNNYLFGNTTNITSRLIDSGTISLTNGSTQGGNLSIVRGAWASYVGHKLGICVPTNGMPRLALDGDPQSIEYTPATATQPVQMIGSPPMGFGGIGTGGTNVSNLSPLSIKRVRLIPALLSRSKLATLTAL